MSFPVGCYPKSQKPLSVPFDPLTIPSMGEWLSIADLAAVGDGNLVGTWAGRKGLVTLTASGAARGTYVADDGDGRPAMRQDGVDDVMYGAADVDNHSLYGTTGDMELWLAFRADPTPAVYSQIFATSGISNFVCVDITALGAARFYFPTTPAVSLAAGSPIDNGHHVVRFTKTGAHRMIQVDGATVLDVTTSAGTYNSGNDVFCLGYPGYAAGMLGAWRHWMSFTAPLDDATAAALTNYLMMA